MKRIAFIVNSTISNKDKKVNELKNCFTEPIFTYKFFFSEARRHIETLTKQAIAENFQYIIVVGGDGTVNEGLNGILESVRLSKQNTIQDFDLTKLANIKFGILPSGSGNDFARTIGATKKLDELKTKILNDSFKLCDIGFAQFLNTEKEEDSRFYMNITDVGMGGEIAQRIVDKNNAFNADLFYLKAIFNTLISYKNTKAKFTSDQETWEGNIMSYVFANGRFFGSGLGVAPEASIQDGKLNIIRLGDINVWDYIYHMKDLKQSKLIKHKEVFYSTANKLKIEPLDNKDLMIDMDGEFVGYAPLKIECIAGVINILQ
ncbi:MAG: diacylglycerol/lipid kinase family protein [Chitinophagales bacterium]